MLVDLQLINAIAEALRKPIEELFVDEALYSLPGDDSEYEDAVSFANDIPVCTPEIWSALVSELQSDNNLNSIVDPNGLNVTLQLPNKYSSLPIFSELSIKFSCETFEYYPEDKYTDFEYGDLYGMTRESAIDYLTVSLAETNDHEPIPEFNYIEVFGNITNYFGIVSALTALPGTKKLEAFLNRIKSFFQKVPDVIATVLADFEAKHAAKQAELDAIHEIEDTVRPLLADAGWDGDFCVVHFTKNLFKIYIRTGNASAYSFRGTKEDILTHIPQLVDYCHQYTALMNQLNTLGSQGYSFGTPGQIKSLSWKKME